MSEDPGFRELLARLRAGEQDAATELLRRYEPQVRRLIRVRLTDPQLRRVFDSADIFQSVFYDFLVKVIEGRYDPQEPGQFIKLLRKMANNKIIDKASSPAHRRAAPDGAAQLHGLLGNEDTPSAALALQEMLQKIAGLLTPEELRLAQLRAEGVSWPKVAAEVGGEAEALRKKLERALQRVRKRLAEDEVGNV